MIKVIVASTDGGDEDVLLGEANLLGGGEAKDEVIEMDDLITSLIDTVSGSINDEGKLRIEISGMIRIMNGPQQGQKIVCFNVHNDQTQTGRGAMKLVIETNIKRAESPTPAAAPDA